MKKICFVATIPAVVHTFLRGHIRAAAEKYQVTVVCNNADAHLLDDLFNGLPDSAKHRLILLPIERKPSLWRDFLALCRMIALFRREGFDLVHSIMPKTGLLGMLAAWIAGAPNRVHSFTGQVWATRQGWRRYVLKMLDRLIVLLATQILADSPSQRGFLVEERVLSPDQGLVIGHGSICGVDGGRFKPDARQRDAVRTELGLTPEQTLILFLGRLNRDKGMLDLAVAFAGLAAQRPDAALLLVGAEEDVSFSAIVDICSAQCDRLRYLRFTAQPERYMAAADIFCLPSYREGFGQVIIEAAACGVPTIASRIYGVTDAVDDGRTGLLFPAGNVAELTRALLKLTDDRQLRLMLGESARMRALALFSSDTVSGAMLAFYDRLLAAG
jgi:glycosyltransferase involved in cell wall biosynthesis